MIASAPAATFVQLRAGGPAPNWSSGHSSSSSSSSPPRGVQQAASVRSTATQQPAALLACLSLVGGSLSAAASKRRKATRCFRPRDARASRCFRRAVPLSELLPPGTAWPEMTAIPAGFEVVAADLNDLSECMDIVTAVFGVVAAEENEEFISVRKGMAGRLGAYCSVVGTDFSVPRPTLRRPVAVGSAEKPEVGLVLALRSTERDAEGRQPIVGLVDISLWPADGRVKAPDARSKPGCASKPYMLNLCVSPAYRRRGLAKALLSITERVLADAWRDVEFYLHVEDDKAPANALYEAVGYEAMDYEYDPDFPYSKAEAKVLRDVTWRRKLLPPALGPAVEFPRIAQPVEFVADDDAEDEEEEEEEDDAPEAPPPPAAKKAAEEDDFDWVMSLKK
eukprot:TRINITY_DN6435_c0_g1_i1.p1 TRINITY_DN6435_c0_g1~~TRINITY_DN6435_c0_g1_i1.p1  ORF type:complete len:394 (+),score=110.69 TRINITY_DN6435_c0_g1_i1:81-1262(+)